jgi:nucleoside-diphosphate-sugar epimerase
MQKVLVTGATGMLGSRLVFDLYQSGIKIRAIYRDKKKIGVFKNYIALYGGDADAVAAWVEWVEADLLDFHKLSEALVGVDFVYNCAAMVSFHPSDREEMFRININGTGNLVNACLESDVKHICHVSSIAALGRSENGKLIDENSAWIPEEKHSGYSITKFHSEMEVWRGVEEGLCAVIVNPSVIIGPGDWRSGSSAFYGQLARGLRFYSSGATGFVDVRDVSAAMLLLTNSDNFEKACGNRFVLNAANMNYREFFSKIATAIGVEGPRFPVKKIMLSLAWRLAFLAGMVTGRKPQITQETALSASKRSEYDGSMITQKFGFQYRPIDESITDIGRIFLKKN